VRKTEEMNVEHSTFNIQRRIKENEGNEEENRREEPPDFTSGANKDPRLTAGANKRGPQARATRGKKPVNGYEEQTYKNRRRPYLKMLK